jgi:threonine aldolase
MAEAEVGDDGFGDDPTVRRLEERVAQLLGHEAALFVPSGVMGNQIAVRVLTRPGDLVIAGRSQHVVSFEMGASARNSSVQFALVEDAGGRLDVEQVTEYLDAEADHQPHVGLIALENTHMPSGGTPYGPEVVAEMVSLAAGRPVHLDGARLFNASVALGVPLADLARGVNTVMVCLSKGLCAPVGSLLVGSSEVMAVASVERKRLGGTMRQVGILAAAGLVALDEMVERLAEDHRRARRLADIVAESFPDSGFDPSTCRTNIVAFNHPSARRLVAHWESEGLLAGTIAPRRVRLVTHAGISDADVEAAGRIIAASAA